MVQVLITVLLAGALSPEQSHQLAERYNVAQAAIGQRNYVKANTDLNALVRDFGSSEFGDEMRYALAETYFNLGQYDRAADIFNQLLGRPHHPYIKPEAMYGIAISEMMRGNFKQARITLEQLSKQQGYDTDDRTNFALGVLYYFLKNYDQAAAKLNGLKLPEAKFYLGKVYSATGKPLPALLQFRAVTDDVPNTSLAVMAHFAAGQALFINHDYDGAQAKFQFFADNFAYSPLADYARYFLGCAQIAQKQYASAIDNLTPLVSSDNSVLAAHANYFIGCADMALGQAQPAVERFQRVRANYSRTRVSGYADLQLSRAVLATADTAQALLGTSQLATMFKTGDLAGTGNYMSGVIYYQLGQYGSAARQFETILASHGGTGLREPACAMLLLCLSSSGQCDKGAALGAKYVTDYPTDSTEWRAKTLYFLAECFYFDRKYNEADDFYQQAYAHPASSDISVYARLGRCYSLYHLGRLNESVRGFRNLVNARLGDTAFTISAYLGYGYSLFNQKEYLKALDVFEPLQKTFPGEEMATVPAYFYAGYSYYQLGYYGQAVDAWSELINRFPADATRAPEAAFRSGDTYFKALEYDKAISMFNFVIERYPFSQFGPPSQALIAQCFYNRKQYLDAVREYQKFVDLYPADAQTPSVRRSLETSYYLAGQEDSAVMDDFLKRFPQSELAAEGQYNKGKLLFDAGAFVQAIAELQKVVVTSPGLPIAADAQLLSAEAYARMMSWREATQAYQKFLDYFPQHEQRAGAIFNLATAYFNSGAYEQSLRHFRTVVDSFPASEFAESARKNADISRKRLGAAEGEGEDAAEPGAPEARPPDPDADPAAPLPAPNKGDNQP
ncbi:tetratricopeptide repeat protein [candidate division WOR-3 bacterium]|uniref:Tetratricopeptide repeat protein n=1 Tax=candidate division WOR-3 bacterium TaxID=2052148 RepID=A0A938BU06_UNCW3|nr:tetratricopeptide repeat protein [candidate division WOR-3 bacterium]